MAGRGGTVSFDVAITLAGCVEVFLYGIYTCLFASVMPSMMKRRTLERASSTAWVFLVTNIVMYIVASLHVVVMLYRFIRAYIAVDHPVSAMEYYFDLLRWDNLLNSILLCTMSWLGDCLVIYRCYHVWDCNLWVILLPSLLVITTIGTNSYVLYWFTHPTSNIDFKTLLPVLNSIYPMALVQNILTTSLLSFKIWRQHRASVAAGVDSGGSALSLIHVLRIVVESAMVYTLQIFVLIILYFRQNNVQFIFQAATVPSIGIVFVLIAFRVHLARNKMILGSGMGTSIPPWFNEGDISVELNAQASSSTSGVPTMTFRVPGAADSFEDHRIDGEASEPFRSSSYNRHGDIGDKV